MIEKTWDAVDTWLTEQLAPPDSALDAALAACDAAGMPPINVAPNQGKLLHLLAQSIGARTILEIGTLGGYSTIWLARALPAGARLITLEINADNADIARRKFPPCLPAPYMSFARCRNTRTGVDDRLRRAGT